MTPDQQRLAHDLSRSSFIRADSEDRDLTLRIGWHEEWLARAVEADATSSLVAGDPVGGERATRSAHGEIVCGPHLEHPDKMDAPRPMPWRAIGRGSPFDNPGLRAGTPGYRKVLWARIQSNDQPIVWGLRDITTRHTLVCDCDRADCHGVVVVRAWRWLRERDRAHAQRSME